MLNDEIQALKEEQDALILAHYYVPGEVQAVADYVGDSYYLAKIAAASHKETVVFCGVRFMGESAKILNPCSRVLLPAEDADCPMAHMATKEQIRSLRETVEDLAVVCYINSDVSLKAESDVCVTSSNAFRIVESLPNKNILFIPDQNLGSYIEKHVPGKTFYYSGGYCHVHALLKSSTVREAKKAHPAAKVLSHPECRQDILALSDYVGSTAQLIARALKGEENEYIVCTEPGVLYEMRRNCPEKKFYPVTNVCYNMKKITPERVLSCLETGSGEVFVDPVMAERARKPLERMLVLAG